MNNKSRFVPAAFLLAFILLFFHKMAFSNLILARGDTFLYFYPYWQAAADALGDGRIPLWNSQLFMGAPLLANSQVGFFYPLNWPVWLLLTTPYAVSASILLHLAIAAIGAYLAARRTMGVGRWAALVTAVLFALGGYVTAQVEHINQLQGMAWLPWYLVVLGGGQTGSFFKNEPVLLRKTAAFALLFSLQLLAGHTQTVFISGVMLIVWLAASVIGNRLSVIGNRSVATDYRLPTTDYRLPTTDYRLPITSLLLGGLLALLITAVQLLPTLELTRFSNRQGGLAVNEVLSFSLNPLLLTRSLLPAYGQSLFSEYTAFLPVTAVLLAVIGAWQWRQRRGVFPALMLVAVGLFLAFGVFNPANWLIVRLPGFNLFRVPARWLLLYAWGMALLAGAGFSVIGERFSVIGERYSVIGNWLSVIGKGDSVGKALRWGMVLVTGLAVWLFAANYLAIWLPAGPEAPLELVAPQTLILWLAEMGLVYWIVTRRKNPRWLLPIILLSLFFTSRSQPYNNLTTPEAYFDLRPPITRLQALAGRSPDRFLSLSDIFFDVGDQAEIDTIYQDQLPPEARYDYTVAIKQKEIIAPNLPLAYGLTSVDGFDGGILPLRSYSQLMRVILPEGETTTDGRLRENLEGVPEAKWLDAFNARYLITDKTGDVWREGVFFDQAHPVILEPGKPVSVGYIPDFEADALWIIASEQPGEVVVETAVTQYRLTPQQIEEDLYAASFPQSVTPTAVTLSPCHPATLSPCQIQALTLVNTANDTFQSLVPGQYRLIHSGDVKIYENLDALPRAFLLYDTIWQPDIETSVAAMLAPTFDPRQTAVLIPPASAPYAPTFNLQSPNLQSPISITQYAPEQIAITTNTPADALLLFTESAYPGWRAAVDGVSVPIYRADANFQAVFVPEGEHEVVFTFASRSFEYGRVLTLLGLGIIAALAFTLLWLRRRR
ncbi:MAG: YfhO family protein [Chloroflexi bacterium]|nr:YfhO family protein [Chloroflexota bacterium]